MTKDRSSATTSALQILGLWAVALATIIHTDPNSTTQDLVSIGTLRDMS